MKLWDIPTGQCLYTWELPTAIKRVGWRSVSRCNSSFGGEADEGDDFVFCFAGVACYWGTETMGDGR